MAGEPSKIACVDLSDEHIEVTELEPEMVTHFIGGPGLSFRLAYDLIKPGTDPLSPENPLIIGAAALTGTKIQAPRWSVVTKYPLTGTIAFASGGMGFGVRLKRAGWRLFDVTK